MRIEWNPHIYKSAMNPVREVDVLRVLDALGFTGESRWVPSAADTAFGLPVGWRIQWTTIGGGHDHLYFVRFDKKIRMLSPMVFHRAFKRENRVMGLNEFMGVLPYTPRRRERVMNKLSPWTHPDGDGYKMNPPVLRRLGWWCSRQVLRDLRLEVKVTT